jgi:hypothetical protein
MEEYEVNAVVTVSCYTKVTANSKEEAIEKVKNRELANFHIDASYSDDEYFIPSNDGMPRDMNIDD